MQSLLQCVRLAALAVGLFAGAGSAIAAGAYYQWVDSSGRTVLSDRPPPEGIKYNSLSSPTDSTPGDTAEADELFFDDEEAVEEEDLGDSLAEEEVEAPEPAVDPAGTYSEPAGDPAYEWHTPEPELATTTIAKDPAKCQQAREIIWTLDSFARIRAEDENGEYRYLDENEQAARRIEAEQAIDNYCE